jgi:hypothetical protein
MENPAEAIRRQRLAELGLVPGSREALEVEYGQVWDADELFKDFEVLECLGPYVAVRRKADGQKGNVEADDDFQFFFRFRPAT